MIGGLATSSIGEFTVPSADTSIRSPRFTPAVAALLIECFSGATVAGGIFLLLYLGYRVPSPFVVAVLVGVFAAVLACSFRQAWWWLPIHLLFVPALLLTTNLQLPSWVFLVAFLLMLGSYWSTYRTQVPLYLSGPSVWREVAQLLPAQPHRFIDLGSGVGGLVLQLAEQRRDSVFHGIELAPFPWFVSTMRARSSGNTARFSYGDYVRCDLGDFDVVFVYLSPAAMPALWHKARAEMRSGTLLLSLAFTIPEHLPDVIVQPQTDGPALYGWRM